MEDLDQQVTKVAIIAAIADNGAIGFQGKLPWNIPEERKLFAEKTAGDVIVCGRYTAEQMCRVLNKNPLGRTLVGIQGMEWYIKNEHYDDEYSWWTNMGDYSLEAIANHFKGRKIWICGGARLYCEALQSPLVTEMHISWIEGSPIADTFFPNYKKHTEVLETHKAYWVPYHIEGIVEEKADWINNIKGPGFNHHWYTRIGSNE